MPARGPGGRLSGPEREPWDGDQFDDGWDGQAWDEAGGPEGEWDAWDDPHADDHVATAYLSPEKARRRAVTLLLLSVVLPGTAQIAAGNKTFGKVVLRIWLGLLGIAVLLGLLALVSLSTVIGIVSAGWFLFIAQWMLFAWALVWAAVLVDAWRLGDPTRQPARTRRRFAIATAALMVLPGSVAYAGTSVSAGRAALSAVFADGPTLPTSQGRYNILLLGGDSGAGREGTRPDSLQLVSIDATTGRAVTFGFARDTENIVFEPGSVMASLMPEGWTCGDDCLLNGLYTWANDHAELFPEGTDDPGILATKEAIESLSGLQVQYYAMVDLNGFTNLVDALGGLEINVMRRTPIGGGTSPIYSWIEPGPQQLDGYHALWYARSREGSSNYERMARQRCVMSAMVDQIDPRTVALRFADLASASTGVLRTDIPQSELGNFAELAMKTRSQRINGVNFVPPLISPWNYDRAEIQTIVEDTIKASRAATEEEAVSTSVVPLPGDVGSDSDIEPAATPEASAGEDSVGDAETSAAGSSSSDADATEEPFDPMARPSEDANAQTNDIASVCTVG